MARTRSSAPEECAVCGASIPPQALACPNCGADERTGWRESSIYDGLELPESAWEEPSDQTAHEQPPSRRGTLAWYWWATAVALLLLLGLAAIGALR